MYLDEDPEFWSSLPHHDIAARCAILHKYRRKVEADILAEKISVARATVSELFLNGCGIEVGAGSRPFPTPDRVKVSYGDVRDAEQLKVYFSSDVTDNGFIDAQNFRGVSDASQDFVISAHVIEHLFDPIGSVVAAARVLRSGGILILAVPDMRFTFDVDRPVTDLDHLIADSLDGGTATSRQAYYEHLMYVHPRICGQSVDPTLLEEQVESAISRKLDIHVHTWTLNSLSSMLDYISPKAGFYVTGIVSIVNENIAVLRKL